MDCLELYKKKKKIRFNLLSSAIGTDAANEVVKQYDFKDSSIPFEKAENGNQSNLFRDLVKSEGILDAISKSVAIHSQEFMEKYGNWISEPESFIGKLDENGEPTIDSVYGIQAFEIKAKETTDKTDEASSLDTLRKTLKENDILTIGDATTEEVNDMVLTGLDLAHPAIKNGKLDKAALYDSLRKQFLNKAIDLEEHLALNKADYPESKINKIQRMADVLNILEDDAYYSNFTKILDREINSLGYKEINKEATTDYNDKIIDDPMMKEVWDSDKKWSIPIKDTMQFSLKTFIGATKRPIVKDGLMTGKYEVNSIGFPKIVPFDSMNIKLINLFSSGVVTKDILINRLQSSGIAEFLELRRKLKTNKFNGDRITNSLVASLNRAKNNKYTIVLNDSGGIVYKSNDKIDRRYIVNDWFANQGLMVRDNNVFEENENGVIFLGEKGLESLSRKRSNILSVLSAKNVDVVEASDFKYALLDKIESLSKSKKSASAIYKNLNKLIKEYNFTDGVGNKLSNFTKGSLGHIVDFTKGEIRSKDINKVKSKLLDLDIKEIESASSDNIDINRVNIGARYIQDFLNSMGMDLELETVKKFLDNPANYMEDLGVEPDEKVTIDDLIKPGTKSKGKNVIYTILEDIKAGNSDLNVSFLRRNNPLNTPAVKNVFSRLKELEEIEDISSTFINSMGKQESTYGFSSNLTDAVKDLRSGKADGLLSDPFTKFSLLHEDVIDKDGKEVSTNKDIDVVFIDALKNAHTGDAVTKLAASPREKELSRINLFAFNNAGFKGKFSIFEPLVFSDKSRRVGLMMRRLNLNKENFKIALDYDTGKASSVELARDVFLKYSSIVASEANRNNHIVDLEKKGETKLTKTYLEGGKRFLLLPELNDLDFVKKFKEDGKYKTAELIKSEELQNYLNGFLQDKINKAIDNWKEYDIISGSGNIKNVNKTFLGDLDVDVISNKDAVPKSNYNIMKEQALLTAAHLTINEHLANFTTMQLLGDPAHFYKKGDNSYLTSVNTTSTYYKRLGSIMGTKIKGNTSFLTKYGKTSREVNHNRVKYIIAEDLETGRYIEDYKGNLNDHWGKSSVTDGTELTTLRDHIVNLHSIGRLDDRVFNAIHNKIINKYRTGKPVKLSSEEEIAIVPQKPLYSGINVLDGVRVPMIVKSSSFPLLDSYTKGTPLDAVRKRMEKIEADELFNTDGSLKEFDNVSTVRLAFKSAVKVGGVEPVKLFNEDHSVIQENLDAVEPIEVSRENFGIQQEESHNNDNSINTVSQMDKLIHMYTANIKDFKIPNKEGTYTGEEVKKMKDDIKKEWIGKKLDNYLKDLKIKKDKSGYHVTDPEALINYIKQKALDNDIPLQSFKLLSTKSGTFEYPLIINRSFSKIVSTLLSDVSKGILRPKIRGKGSVQISNIGMAFKNGIKDSGIIFTDKFKGRLDYTRYEGNNLKSAQVFLSREYLENKGVDIESLTKVNENGDRVIDTDKLDPELLNSIGARIPNQSHSSMLNIEIVGFLPREFKDTVVVPDEITRQMGSDFDIDHLYKYLYNFKVSIKGKNKGDGVKPSDNPAFMAAFKKYVNKRRFDPAVNRVVKTKDTSDFRENGAFVAAAREVGMIYDSKTKLIYPKNADIRVEKITRDKPDDKNIAALENEYIDIHRGILNHSEIAKRATETLDLPDTEEIANELNDLTSHRRSTEKFSPLDYEFNSQEYENNQGGKDGISIQSSVSMLMANLENKRWKIEVNEDKDEPLEFEVDGSLEKFTDIGLGKYNYNGVERTNADNNAMMQGEAVDNANNKRLRALGYSSDSAAAYNGFQFLLSHNGKALPLEMIALMLNQKGVVDGYKKVSLSKDMFESGAGLSDQFETAADSYKIDRKVIISRDKLVKALEYEKGKGDMTEDEYNAVQKKVLKLVATAHKYGSNIMRIYSSLNFETKGVGSTVSELLNKDDNLNIYVKHNRLIPDAKKLLDTLVDKNGKVASELTAAGKIADIATDATMQIWGARINGSPITLLGSSKYKSVIRSIGKNVRLTDRDMGFIERGFTNFTFNSVANPLFVKNGVVSSLKDVRASLLLGKDNLYARIKDHLKDKTNLEGREFLKVIGIHPIENTNEPIIFKTNLTDTSEREVNNKINSFNELLTSHDTKSRELAQDILKIMMLQGNTYAPGSLNIFMPFDYIKGTAISDELKKVNPDKMIGNRVYEQILQHNPRLAQDYRTIKDKITVPTYKTEDTYFLAHFEPHEVPSIPDYVNERVGQFNRLYKHIGEINGEEVYKRLSALGNGKSNFYEFDPHVQEATSLINANNPKQLASEIAKKNNRDDLALIFDKKFGVESVKADATITRSNTDIIKNHFGLNNTTDVPVQKILLEAKGSNKRYAKFINGMLYNDSNAKVTFNTKLPSMAKARTTVDGIEVNPNAYDSRKQSGNKIIDETFRVVAHESLHKASLTSAVEYMKNVMPKGKLKLAYSSLDRLRNSIIEQIETKDSSDKDAFKSFNNDLQDILTNPKSTKEIDKESKDKFYGLSDIKEFIGETANDAFINYINGFELPEGYVSDVLPGRLEKVYNEIIAEKGLKKDDTASAVLRETMRTLYEIKAKEINKREEVKEKVAKDKPPAEKGVIMHKGKEYRYNPETNDVTYKSGRKLNTSLRDQLRVDYLLEKNTLSEQMIGSDSYALGKAENKEVYSLSKKNYGKKLSAEEYNRIESALEELYRSNELHDLKVEPIEKDITEVDASSRRDIDNDANYVSNKEEEKVISPDYIETTKLLLKNGKILKKTDLNDSDGSLDKDIKLNKIDVYKADKNLISDLKKYSIKDRNIVYGTDSMIDAINLTEAMHTVTKGKEGFTLTTLTSNKGEHYYLFENAKHDLRNMWHYKDSGTRETLREIALDKNKVATELEKKAAKEFLKYDRINDLAKETLTDAKFYSKELEAGETFDAVADNKGSYGESLIRIKYNSKLSDFLHEVSHAYTIDLLRKSPEAREYVKEMMNDYKKALEELGYDTSNLYNVEEFAAEALSNSDIDNVLREAAKKAGRKVVTLKEYLKNVADKADDVGILPIFEIMKGVVKRNNYGKLVPSEEINFKRYLRDYGDVNTISSVQKLLIGEGFKPDAIEEFIVNRRITDPLYSELDLIEEARKYCK